MKRELEFYYAVTEDDMQKLKALIQEEPNFCREIMPYQESLVYHAAVNNRSEIVDFLLGKGCDPDSKNAKGYTALHVASLYGFTNIVASLIRQHATVDIQDNYGNTPLLEAVFHFKNEIDTIALLIKSGANPFRENKTGVSSFQLAIDSKNTRVLQYFESMGIKN